MRALWGRRAEAAPLQHELHAAAAGISKATDSVRLSSTESNASSEVMGAFSSRRSRGWAGGSPSLMRILERKASNCATKA